MNLKNIYIYIYINIHVYTQGEPYVLKNVSYPCISADTCPLAVYIFLYIMFWVASVTVVKSPRSCRPQSTWPWGHLEWPQISISKENCTACAKFFEKNIQKMAVNFPKNCFLSGIYPIWNENPLFVDIFVQK